MPEVQRPIFSIDTSCLINSWNLVYQIDILPSIWIHLETMLETKRAVATIQVFEEIERKDDALLEWCKARKHLFTDVSDEQLVNLKGIMTRHQRIAAVGSGRNYADPWVIALAQCYDPLAIVVTEEDKGKQTNPKIPYICGEEGVQCYTFNRFLRESDWKESQ